MNVEIRRIESSDNLTEVAASIIGKNWSKDNELNDFDESALRQVVENPETILLIAYANEKPVGMVRAVKVLRPDGEHWLLVDELDTHPDYRQQGIATKLMKKIFDYAKEWKLDEVWLGTETDNQPANELYKSLNPTEIEETIGYTFRPH